ncbi:MAG: transglutaminase family protein [Pseudomonadota bacterium]
MTRLTACHRTRYRYASPVGFGPHRLMLCPKGQHDVRLIDNEILCTPPARLDWSQDVFGNLVATAHFTGHASEMVIESRFTIDHKAEAWPIFAIDPVVHDYPFRYSDGDCNALGAYLIPNHPDPDGTLMTWARGFVAGDRTDTLALLKDLANGIWPILFYRERDEEGTQAPLETLALGSGSCRDFATLFIDAARALGFGARAVSGYLAGDPTHASNSTHAWAEIYLPGAGWIACDPTHGTVGGRGLIPVAVARAITQIMPIEGSFLGAPGDFIDMQVDVTIEPVA